MRWCIVHTKLGLVCHANNQRPWMGCGNLRTMGKGRPQGVCSCAPGAMCPVRDERAGSADLGGHGPPYCLPAHPAPNPSPLSAGLGSGESWPPPVAPALDKPSFPVQLWAIFLMHHSLLSVIYVFLYSRFELPRGRPIRSLQELGSGFRGC